VRVTLLGHASVLVEMEAATCLMDPVFFDPFEEGVVVSCPRRRVHLDRLPPIDILVISHRHPDHFDLRSLHCLARDCQVVCPADPLIVYALRELGFESVQPVEPMGEIAGDGFELFPTRSELGSLPEMGMVFHDRSGTFWNQVDTSLSAETIEVVRRRFAAVDLLFAMYASQNFDFFEDRTTEFPLQTHRENLGNALRIRPRLAVPASAGFRFTGELAWLNAFVFPIARERFVRDLAALEPAIQTRIMNPGDAIELEDAELHSGPAESGIAVTEGDDTALIRFDPTAPIPELADPNPSNLSAEELLASVATLVVRPFSRFLDSAEAASDRVVRAYQRVGVNYEVAIVLPGDDVHSSRFQIGPPGAEVVHRIAASVLVDWVTGKRSFFSVRGWSRRHQLSYRLARRPGGITAEPIPLPDLLMHYLINLAPGSELAAKRHLDHALSQLASTAQRG
jgi:L-ascorbate metabolism protein UlaG (beta-lactamase superfamily)